MKSVWLVERGEYSDYRVEAIFETKEQADEFAAHLTECPSYKPSVREWVLDIWLPAQAKYEFCFDLSGNIVKETVAAYIDDAPTEFTLSEWSFGKDEIWIATNRGTRDLAVKVAFEKYVRIRAFFDEALERVEKAKYHKNGNYRFSDAVRVAKVLAGLEPPPNPPRCGHDRNILLILRIKELKETHELT